MPVNVLQGRLWNCFNGIVLEISRREEQDVGSYDHYANLKCGELY